MEVITDLRALRRALESGATVEKVLCPAGRPYPPNLYRLLRQYQVPIQQVPARTLPPQATWGVAYLSPIPFVSVEAFLSAPAQGLMVALIGLTDVRNVGAILRSGAAFGVKAILWPTSKSVSPSNDELWRSSAGALRQLTIVRSQRPHSDIQRLAEHGWRLVATTRATPQATPLHHWSWNCPSLLLLGNEEKGLPAAYMNLTPFHLTIPHDPRMESLNVSAAAAIFFWHYYQGRHT